MEIERGRVGEVGIERVREGGISRWREVVCMCEGEREGGCLHPTDSLIGPHILPIYMCSLGC